MLFDEFDRLPTRDQVNLIIKWKLDNSASDIFSFQELQHRIHHLEWSYSQLFTIPTILDHGLVMNPYLDPFARVYASSELAQDFDILMFHRIRFCFQNYSLFFLLCSSKTRVGKGSFLRRLPNELFYKVIELFFTT